MNLSEIRDRVGYKLNDRYLQNTQHAFIDDVINEAIDMIANATHWNWTIATMNSTANVRDYPLNTGGLLDRDIYKIMSVAYMTTVPNTFKFLDIQSHYYMDRNSQTWLSTSAGTPSTAVIDPSLLSLDPMPDTSVIDAIRMLIFLDYPKLVNATDKVLLPKSYAKYIPIYVYNTLKNDDAQNNNLRLMLEKERGKNIFYAEREFHKKLDLELGGL